MRAKRADGAGINEICTGSELDMEELDRFR